jgi:hypothetical protein
VSDRYDFWQPSLKEGVGVYAPRTNGSWAVHHTRFANNRRGAIVARGASPAGNATLNLWADAAASGPERCVGNVDCSTPSDADTLEDSTPAPPSTSRSRQERRQSEPDGTATASGETAAPGGADAPSNPLSQFWTSVVSLLLGGVVGVAIVVVLTVSLE